jgi:RHS repeat-associated protein
VKIDVSGVNAAAGKLVVQLLNQDSDGRGNVKVTNFVDRLDDQGTPGRAVNPYVTPATPGTAVVLDGYLGTTNGQLLLSDVSFDKATGKYSADLRVKNVGSTVLSRNLAVLLSELPAGVTVSNASGIHAAGSAYLNFATAIQAGGLAGGAISGAIRVEINDPNLKAFGFKPVVLQGAAEPIPDLSTLRNLTVKVGDKLDFALDPNLALSISAVGDLPTGSITGDSHLVFNPAPDQIGTYEFTLIARNGSTETRQAVTLNVVADPITTTRVTGVIANTNQAGIAGVLVELAGQQATTDAAGRFELVVPDGAAGDTLKIYGQRIQGGGITYPFIAEKMNLLLGHDVYQGVNNAIDRPIYLPTVDISTGVTVNPNIQTIATNPNLVGAKVVVNPYTLYDKNGNAFTGTLTITEVPINLTPAALPENLRPDLVVTIQPGDMVFNTPALLTLPNLAGYAPGTDMDLWSINPNSGEFERVGLARVSKNGQVVETIEGGIRNSSWHFFAPPAPPGGPTPPPPRVCVVEDSQEFNSQVSLNTGVVTESHDLVSYKSLGQDQSLSLTYSSLRADARPIINFNFGGLGVVGSNPSAYLVADLSVTDGNFIQKTANSFWRISTGNTGTATTSLLVDLRDRQSGRFDYSSNSGFNVFERFGASKTTVGKVINVNFVNSNFGAGWGIAGVQEIVENRDGSALLINGNGSEIVFEKPKQPDDAYQNQPGDLSKLVKLADGTFQRTTTDQTVYQFDSKNRLVSVKDRLGRETKHVYNPLGQLTQVIDPAGLSTSFAYGENGKLSTINDPVNRITRMAYDEHGNLLKIIDPTGATRTFSYDSLHHMTGEINPQGGVEQSFYDPISGRAIHSIRPDGSEIRLTPQQTIGLFDPKLTKSISTAPYLKFTGADNVLQATYIDSNGNISYSKLDSKGLPVAASDAIGVKTKQTYDAKNQLISETDVLGNITNYVYDENGNVVRRLQESSTAVNTNSIGSILTDFNLESFGQLPDDINVEMSDINHDGYQDAVILNKFYNNSPQEFFSAFASASRTSLPNGISIWLGNATGQFTAGDTYNLFTSNTSVNLKDLNGDDNVDMLVGRDQEALVYLGDGKGSFSQSATYNINSSKANTLGLVDINGDGLDDMFYRDFSKFYLRLGRGIGEFGAALETDVDWQDFNGGGYGGAGVVAFAALSAPVSTPTALGQISTGDLDGDGKTDWLVATSQGFRAILNKGFCDYQPQAEVTQNANLTSESSVTLLDIDNDGDLDVLRWAPETSGVGLYLNSGNATFTFSRTISVGTSIRSITTTDFDGNDTIDLLVTGTSGTAGILLGNTDGTFQTPQSLSSLPSNVKSIAVGDFDGYGLNDLLVFTPTGITLTPGWSLALQQSVRPGAVTSYTYDPIWNKLTSEVDPLGRKTLYEIDSVTGNELSITRVVGLVDAISSETNDVTTRFTYTAQGLLDTTTDALGRISDNDYDLRGNLVRSIQGKGTADEVVTTYEYDLAGNQTAMVDPLGRRTEYFYDQANNLVREVQADPDGAGSGIAPVTEYQYDLMGRQVLVRDPNGNVTRYEYDLMGRMTKMISADPDGNGAQVSAVTTYEYDLVGNQVAVVDPLGRRTTSIYDARNRLVATVDATGGKRQTIYDLDNRVIASIDANGNRRSSIYDAEGRVVREVNALSQVRDTEFDAAGQVVSMTDALGRKTRYQYDELGRQVAVTDALGHVTRTEYNKVGNTVAVIDANGNRTEFKFDVLDRQIEVKDAQGGLTKTVYDKVGNTLSVTDALNRSTTFVFDDLNRGIRTTDALGNSTTSAFDAAGNLLGVTDALGRVTTYAYDALNRKITTTDVLGQTQSVAYDLVGNMVSDTNQLSQVTTHVYDVLDRRIKVTDALGHTQTTTYDLEGNVRSTSDGTNNTTRYDYDALNRQVKVTDANNGITSTNYDAVGNLAKITDSVGNSTTYTYDAVNRLLTDTNQLGFSRRYGYDNVGNRVEMIDRNNRKTTYIYDSLNRRTGENWAGVGGVSLRAIDYTYDAVGNMITANDSDAKYTYIYDALNRLATLDNSGTNGVPAVTFIYSYDEVGRVVAVADKINGTNISQTDYTYDLLDRATRITQSGTGAQSKRVDLTYNKVNQITGLSRFSDLGGQSLVAETSYTYDQNQRLIELAHQKGANNLASYDYTFDAANKLTKIVSSIDGTVDYAYDSTNQLTGADHSTQADEAYQYDANGNRTNAGYQIGTNNQLQADGQFTYEYDGEGNRTKRTQVATGKVTEYVWDYRNRLTGVLFKNSAGVLEKNVEYIYDTNNLRIGKKIDGVVTERFVIDRNQLALVFDGLGAQKSRYLYGTQVDQVLAEESGAQVHWFLTDHQGTVKDVVDNAGIVIDHVAYDSFGRIVGQTSPIDLRFAYTGREWDGETGQYYYRARYYDAAVGKFISEDPIGFDAGDTNFHRYVENDPLNSTDPSGLVRVGFVIIVGTASRTISFLDRRGSYRTVSHIQSAINFFNRSGFIRMVGDETVAFLSQSPFRSPTASGTGSGTPYSSIPGYRTGLDAGHIIGNQLGGSGTDLNNLFAQTRAGINQRRRAPGVSSSDWRDFEDMVARNITTLQFDQPICPSLPRRQGHPTALINIKLRYDPNASNTLRPVGITGTARYYGPFRTTKIPTTFVNAPNY